MRKATRWFTAIVSVAFLLSAASLHAADSGEWIELFNGRDLSGWKLRDPNGRNGWSVRDGVMVNKLPSTDLLTEKWFKDFDLHLEFNIPRGSNSGIYILGRYEIQIQDDYGKPARTSSCGALYREVAPAKNVCKKPGEWQTYDIHFRSARFDEQGRKLENARVTLVFNGVKVLDDIEIKGPTGSRKRFDEETPGPILIQGDHGPIMLRNIRIRGKVYNPPSPDEPGPPITGVEIQPCVMAANKAHGLELTWLTRNHAYAPIYKIYRGESPDFPADRDHFLDTAVKRRYRDCSFEKDGTYYYKVAALGLGGKPGPLSKVASGHGPENQVTSPYLGDESWAYLKGDYTPKRNRSYTNRTIRIHGRTFRRGIGTRGNSLIRLNVARMVGDHTDYRFRATVGLDDSMRSSYKAVAAARFIVRADGKTLFDSGKMRWADGAKEIDVPIPAGTRKLDLVVKCEGARRRNYSDWADPRLEQKSE